MRGIGSFYEFQIRCVGTPDPRIGYLLDIKAIDAATREGLYPSLIAAVSAAANSNDGSLASPDGFLLGTFGPLNDRLGNSLRSIRWHLTPTYSLEAVMSPSHTATVLLRQRFDFAAAHRLHAPHLSDEENRRLFGKCNNPNGHGHNYQFEPCVALSQSQGLTTCFDVARLEEICDRVIMDRFDHKHLNLDTTEFNDTTGVNPSVENIAKVFFELLAPEVSRAGATLRSMTVWETDRTCAEYPG